VRVSLITVCRNSVLTIKDTIESIIAQQEDDDIEYIIVDGASNDGTLDVIKKYEKYISKIISEEDAGIADAFNKGIKLVTGDVIGIINSDDILLPGAVKKIKNYFLLHPDVEVVHGDVMLFEGARLIKRLMPSARWWYFWRFVLFNHPTTFVKREIYKKYGLFNIKYKIAMDVDIFLRWLKIGVKLGYLSEPLVKMQTGGMSGQNAFQAFREAKRASIENGYSKLLSWLQYTSRLLLHVVLNVSALLQKRTISNI
jgi:glycosyltransferase involved in cell wall biosynthesis